MVSRPYSCSITMRAVYCASDSVEHVGTLHIGGHHLASPPLVCHLVRGDVEDDIDVFGVVDA